MLDIEGNRADRKWTTGEQLTRVLWALARPLFVCSPRIAWGWRRGLLRLFGAKIGAEAHIYPNVRIEIPWNVSVGAYAAVGDHAILYALGRITIGEKATVSQGAHLCAGTHDFRNPQMPLLKMPIVIEDGAWIAADAFVGPGVTIGRHAVVGARGVAVRDVPPEAVVAGNPARVIGSRQRSTSASGPTHSDG
jgi:putative colanic acid biosynthesis acetyltransferase WcaF